jgi:lipoprotein
MFKLTNKKYVLIVILFPAIFILLVSCFIYFSLKFYSSNRIYSIRKVPEDYRVSLVNNFINNNYKDKSILLLGDSQPNGFGYPTKYIFSTLLENKIQKNIINLAFQDSRILDNTFILEYLYQHNMKFENIVYNINQSHVKDSNFSRLKEKGHIQRDFSVGIISELKSFTELAIMPNPKTKPDEALKFKTYEDYFKTEKNDLEGYIIKLEMFIKLAKKVSDNVILYITPHCLNAVKYNNEKDLEKIKYFSKYILKFCENKDIKCVSIDITEDKFYVDIVHFNSRGHEKMSDILFDILK